MNRSVPSIRHHVLGLAILAAFLAPTAAAQGGGNPNPGTAPLHSKVNGKSYGQWSALWWQWATSIPAAINPVLDPTGANAHEGQSGNMFFLAGTFGGSVVRNVTIPHGKKLLVAVVNQEWDNVYGFDPLGFTAGNMSVADLRAVCDYIIDGAINLSCTMDGVPVQDLANYRVPSTVFTLNMDPTMAALWGYPAGPIAPCVADGIYVIYNPPTPGTHVLNIHAEIPLYSFVMDVTYNITIQ